MKKIAFVVPWYGDQIPGGAEMETRMVLKHLNKAGIQVEVLTTCVKEFASNWYEDYYSEGETLEDGILVRRFAARKGNKTLFEKINAKLLSGKKVSKKEEEDFLTHIVNSDNLYAYMASHQQDYDLFIFIPYMFGTTYNGVQICPEKSVLIPCFHDECYLYFQEFKKTFSKIKGLIYNSLPESVLANRVYNLKNVNQITMGIGMNTDITGNSMRFRKKYKIEEPFILYAGRKDKTKNVHTLIRYFERYKREENDKLQLVLIGPGEIPIPDACKNHVHDLGFVPVQDKYDAYAAAEMLCQPSKNESFSFVIMESWLMGRPVMVHQECKVTTNFVVESNGGLYFKSYSEFAEEIKYLLGHPQIADILGKQGQDYVKQHFSWETITAKYIGFLKACVN